MQRRLFIAALVAAAAAVAAPPLATAQDAGPEVGQKAPDFSLPWADREAIHFAPEQRMSLAGLKGKTVILAFYPADWSSGCTKEVCTLRDDSGFKKLTDLGAVLLGVSGDYVFSHHEWAKHHNLPFALLSDHDHAVARAYASYNPEYGLNKRTVYVIGPDGVVRYKNLKFNAGAAADYDALRAAVEAASGAKSQAAK